MMRIESSTFYSMNENDRFLCKRHLRRSRLEDLRCYDRKVNYDQVSLRNFTGKKYIFFVS